MVTGQTSWVLLSYRIPREPSTPRIAIWRRLRDLGVAQLGDGLVALPQSVRNKELIQWVAAQVIEANGEAMVWDAMVDDSSEGRRLADSLNEARQAEYSKLIDETEKLEAPVDLRTLARLRRNFRRIDRRDYFKAPLRDRARLAITDVADDPGKAKKEIEAQMLADAEEQG